MKAQLNDELYAKDNPPLQRMYETLMPKPIFFQGEVPKGKKNWWSVSEWRKDMELALNAPLLMGYIPTFIEKCRELGIQVKDKPKLLEDLSIDIHEKNKWAFLYKKDTDQDELNEWLQDALKKAITLKEQHSSKEESNPDLINKEGYYLWIDHVGMIIYANASHGCFNGLQTFLQMAKWAELNTTDEEFVSIEIADYPKTDKRAFHLDLKDLMPSVEYTKDLLEKMAHYKYNCVVIEYEDKFPYEGYLSPVVHEHAWSRKQFHEIMQLCENLFLEVIPLIQIFGHVEFILEKEEFKHLQETPDGKPIDLKDTYQVFSLCPLHSESEKLAFEIVDQIIEAHPNSEFIHIGADEVYQLGNCPKCKKYLEDHTKSELYIQFINKVATRVLEHNKFPIMWHDYLLKYPENLEQLHKDIVIMYWIYKSWRDENLSEEEKEAGKILPHFEFFQEKGFRTMGAPSISSDFDLLIPNLRTRIENIAGQAMRVKESESLGTLITSWVVCANPLDTQICGVCIGAELMWDPPNDWHSDKLPWNHYEKALQTQLFTLQEHQHRPWLKELFEATERRRKIYPAKVAMQKIPHTIKNTQKIKEQANSNQEIIQAMLLGLDFLRFLSDLMEGYEETIKNFKPYSEAEGERTEFPTMEKLAELLERFQYASYTFEKKIQEAESYYIDETQQILPDQWMIIYGMERYHPPDWIIQLEKNLSKLIDGLDGTLMSILRQQMELKI